MSGQKVRMNDHCISSGQGLTVQKDGLVLGIISLMSTFIVFTGYSYDSVLINTHRVTTQWLAMCSDNTIILYCRMML